MKRFLSLSALLLVAYTGCMDMNLNLKLKQNWAGSFDVKLEMLDQIFQLMQVQAQQSGMELAGLLDEEVIAQKVKENGGSLEEFSNSVEDGMRKVLVKIKLPNMRQALANLGGGQMAITADKDEWLWTLSDSSMADPLKQMDPATLEQQLTMMAPTMTGLTVNIDVEVPTLVDTNLTRGENNTTHFSFNFDRDVSGKQGQALVDAFLGLLGEKWIRFKGVQ